MKYLSLSLFNEYASSPVLAVTVVCVPMVVGQAVYRMWMYKHCYIYMNYLGLSLFNDCVCPLYLQ